MDFNHNGYHGKTNIFSRLAHATALKVGSPITFFIALLLIVVWAVSGPLFRFSNTWQLIINTGTTIVTFLLVILLQNTQNHDARAVHLKLDELIRAGTARNVLMNLESLSDEELEKLHVEFQAIREKAVRRKSGHSSHPPAHNGNAGHGGRVAALLLMAAASLTVTLGLTAGPSTANAQEVPPATATPVIVPEPPVPLTVLAAVTKGRAMLQAIVDERNKTRKEPHAVPNAMTANITLAVWNRKDDSIVTVDAKKSGTDLTITAGPKLPIKVTYSAKLESQYAIPSQPDLLVVGVIYPVVTKTVTKKATTYAATDVVYVPYSSAFYVPEMLAAGSDYLSFLIQESYDELRAKGIKSRAYPDKLVADVVDPYLVKSIAVIEHSDVGSLTKGEEQERAIGRFLVKVATNRGAAFGSAISSAGAAGMVQFIPSTYALMVNKRSDLGLIPDFRKGMADHKNAVKAQIAYIDMDLSGMATVRSLYETDRARAGEYLAASYNGGSARVKKAYTTFGDQWFQSSKALIAAAKVPAKGAKATAIKNASLRDETVGYVAKLKRAYSMFSAGYFATPNAPTGGLPAQTAVAAPAASGALAVIPAGRICFGDGSCSAMN